MKRWKRAEGKKGFTLVELIVVLVILAILIAMLVPALTGYIDKAKDKKAEAKMKLIEKAAVTAYDEVIAKYPDEEITGLTYNSKAPQDTEYGKLFESELRSLVEGDVNLDNLSVLWIHMKSGSHEIESISLTYIEDGKTYICERDAEGKLVFSKQ